MQKTMALLFFLLSIFSALAKKLFSNESNMFLRAKRPKIVVIGGGLAGLTAAYRLRREGQNIADGGEAACLNPSCVKNSCHKSFWGARFF